MNSSAPQPRSLARATAKPRYGLQIERLPFILCANNRTLHSPAIQPQLDSRNIARDCTHDTKNNIKLFKLSNSHTLATFWAYI